MARALRREVAYTGEPNDEPVQMRTGKPSKIPVERIAELELERERNELRAEVERLRAVIADAEHTDWCEYVRAFRRWQSGPQHKHTAPSEGEFCTCFLSAALREEPNR